MREKIIDTRPSTKMWIGIGAAVIAYDSLSPKGETLSERCHDVIDEGGWKRYAIYAGLATTAFHLANGFRKVGLPDPFTETVDVVKRLTRIEKE